MGALSKVVGRCSTALKPSLHRTILQAMSIHPYSPSIHRSTHRSACGCSSRTPVALLAPWPPRNAPWTLHRELTRCGSLERRKRKAEFEESVFASVAKRARSTGIRTSASSTRDAKIGFVSGTKNGALNLDRYNVPRTKRINESTTLLAHGFAPF